ncbi:hypothetical protein TR51_33535 [Kitasatospora griseola]|uniref:Uncharacterized protein n=1 Tax=Kitasatospora griseola TaxID=2064 RepID=A0A0D0PLX8_KITGR|nr:hypothetical protein [Kitasatospora griseola]KIQ63549.1 hypothetical protein TR51_33535 [Kitasatospora griseola]
MLLTAAAVLMLLSAGFTIELEGPPELDPGLHDNRTFLAQLALEGGLLLLVAGLGLGVLGPGRVISRIAVVVVAVPLLAFGVFRVTALVPMLRCHGNSIEQVTEGSYRCYDR